MIITYDDERAMSKFISMDGLTKKDGLCFHVLCSEICSAFSGFCYCFIKTFATNAVRMLCTECVFCMTGWEAEMVWGELWRLLKGLNFHSELLNSHLQPEYFHSTLITLQTTFFSFFSFVFSYRFPFIKQVVKQEKLTTSGKKRNRLHGIKTQQQRSARQMKQKKANE